jgi:hypothetical protein
LPRARIAATAADMVTCQTIGHCWYPIDADRRPAFGWLWSLRCDRCGTVRDDLVDHRGDLLSRGYRYPEGYRDAALNTSRAERRRGLLTAEPQRRVVRLHRPRAAS